MLRFLRIKHLAVIDTVELEFDAGLNVLTGETGAGKSILVEAVGLLLGGPGIGRPRSDRAKPPRPSKPSSRAGEKSASSAGKSPARGAAVPSSTGS